MEGWRKPAGFARCARYYIQLCPRTGASHLPASPATQGMIKVLKLFFRAEGTRPYLVLACLLLAALSEAVGVGTLLPALVRLDRRRASDSPQRAMIFRGFRLSRPAARDRQFHHRHRHRARPQEHPRLSPPSPIPAGRWRASPPDCALACSMPCSGRGGAITPTRNSAPSPTQSAMMRRAPPMPIRLRRNFAASLVQNLAYALVALFIDWKLGLIGMAIQPVHRRISVPDRAHLRPGR